jgi:2-hydroxychromene-2-carboxylate isomerase
MKRVEFYFDLVSPYSYLAYGRVGRICEENGKRSILTGTRQRVASGGRA